MKPIDVFYQGEGIGEIEYLEIESDATFAALKACVCRKHGLGHDTLIFLEDGEDPADEAVLVRERARAAGIKVHLHRCRHVNVAVTFNGQTVEHPFAPGTTVAHVKRWAAERRFGMTAEEAGEHVLQITGTQDRPPPGTHIGTLVICPACQISFDLVADERINGAVGAEV